jgi:hypothetical protein
MRSLPGGFSSQSLSASVPQSLLFPGTLRAQPFATFVEDSDMERNDSFGTGGQQGSGSTGGYGGTSGASGATGGTGSGGSTGGSGSLGGSTGGGYGGSSYGGGTSGGGSTAGGSTGGYGSGSGSTGGDSQSRVQQGREAVTDAVSNVRDKAGDLASSARDRASNLKSTIADKLEAGAERLRSNRGGAQQFAGTGGATAGTSDQLGQIGGRAADALQSTAEFLRDGDLKATIEQQVKEHPGRTLLIALGLGYVLGKAFRR